MMDSLFRSKLLDLKKSFCSTENHRVNNTEVTYGLRSASRNLRKQSVYSKFSNRTHGGSEVRKDQNITLTNRDLATHSAFGRNNETFSSKTDRAQTLNGNSRDAVESSFRLQYSNTSPVKSTHEIHERSNNPGLQFQNGRLPEDRMERDIDGFVIPTAINRPKPRIVVSNESDDERLTKVLLSDLLDNLPAVEAFYYLKRYEEWLIHEKRKKTQVMLNSYHGMDKDKSLRVMDWLHSNACAPDLGNRGWNREMVEDYVSVSSRNTMHHNLNPCQLLKESNPSQVSVFLIKNWTIIKGNGPIDVMISGDLRDIKDQTLIEEGHVTSQILSADGTIVKTICCVYHLIGKFSDPSQSIPDNIKKYFVDGKFPKQWKEVVRNWNLIKQNQSMLCFSNRNHINRYGDRNERDVPINNRKRRAPTNHDQEIHKQVQLKKCRLEQPNVSQHTPMTRRSSNFSMITRSALRKIQSRSDYSFLGTPKSSKVYNKYKNRIKTPMPPRGGRENQVKEYIMKPTNHV